MRIGDLDALRKNMEFICMGIMAGTEPYNAPLTEIDNAPTVEERSYEQGFRDGYAQCIANNEERKESNRLFQERGKEE